MAALIQRNQSEVARIRLKPILDANPNDVQVIFLFGLSYQKEQKYGQSRLFFERARAADELFPPTHYFLGWALYYLGELEQSRLCMDKFLTFRPDDADAHFALGLIDMDEGDVVSAEKRFRKSIELSQVDPRHPDTRQMSKGHARLGELYEQDNRLEDAKAELVLATALFPDHYEAYYKLARVLTRLGETEAANEARHKFFLAKERVRPGSTGGAATRPEAFPIPTTGPARS